MEYKLVDFDSKICYNISNKLHNQLLKLALKSLNQIDINRISEIYKRDNNISDKQFCKLMEMYISIINLFKQSSKEDFEENLLKHGYSAEFIENLPLKHKNKDSILSFTKTRPLSVNRLSYKIDISLQNSALNKVVLPSTIFSLKYLENKDITFLIDNSKFHILRYNIAVLVKEFNTLKNTNIVKKNM